MLCLVCGAIVCGEGECCASVHLHEIQYVTRIPPPRDCLIEEGGGLCSTA